MKKNKTTVLYKETWFWLMLIFFIITIGLVLLMIKWSILSIIKESSFWVALGSIGTFLSAIIAVISIVYSEKIRRQKDTYNAFSHFKQRNFNLEQKIKDYDIYKLAESYKEGNGNNWEYKSISKYLCDLEEFSVCVNAGVFNLTTVNNMGGPYLIEMFDFLLPIIQAKRKIKKRNTIYDQYEKLVANLKKINES